jgi:hypothetical protein
MPEERDDGEAEEKNQPFHGEHSAHACPSALEKKDAVRGRPGEERLLISPPGAAQQLWLGAGANITRHGRRHRENRFRAPNATRGPGILA